jgi:hypothetical protein
MIASVARQAHFICYPLPDTGRNPSFFSALHDIALSGRLRQIAM